METNAILQPPYDAVFAICVMVIWAFWVIRTLKDLSQ